MILLLAVYVVLTAIVVAAYPELRGERLLWLYTGVEVGGAVLAAWLYLRHVSPVSRKNETPFGTSRRARKRKSTTDRCALVLICASLATTVLPKLAGPGMLERWPAVVGAWAVALLVVVAWQVRGIWRER